jgi:hypothetical protein
MVLMYSATKGLASMTLAIAHSRGWLDYEERVARYWPEFAQHGKEEMTVRQLLAHQAGLFAFDEPVDRSAVADLDRLAIVLARQKPRWKPGTRQAYHASRSASTKLRDILGRRRSGHCPDTHGTGEKYCSGDEHHDRQPRVHRKLPS